MYTNDMQEEDPWLPVRTVMEVGSRPPDGEERLGIAVLHERQYGCVGCCTNCLGYGTRSVYEYLQQSGIYIYIIYIVKCSRYRPGVAHSVGRGIAVLFYDRGTRRG